MMTASRNTSRHVLKLSLGKAGRSPHLISAASRAILPLGPGGASFLPWPTYLPRCHVPCVKYSVTHAGRSDWAC